MEMPKATDKKRRTSFIGNWNLSCGSEIQESKGSVWDYLHKINEEAPDLFPNPPSKNIRKYDGSMLVLCWTSDYRNEERVRRAAEFIRKRVHFPFPIHYFKLGSRDTLYLHTPEGEFYEHLQYGWSLVDRQWRTKTTDSEHSWRTDSRNASDSSHTMKEELVPSQVLDTEYIYMPSTEEGIEAIKRRSCGKWMVFSESLEQHDAFWSTLVSLYIDGTLVGLKASTVMISHAQKQDYSGFRQRDTVINCYTADSENRDDVKKVATAIYKVIPYKYILYYKTNGDSMDGKYPLEGCKKVTKYMRTIDGGLYERDEFKRWKLSSR